LFHNEFEKDFENSNSIEKLLWQSNWENHSVNPIGLSIGKVRQMSTTLYFPSIREVLLVFGKAESIEEEESCNDQEYFHSV